jgi:hypothetical protein
MTKPGDQPPSNFGARADSAALALRANLNRQGRQVPDSAPVEVDSRGNPPAPLPPEGSYARQNLELQRRQAQAQQGGQPTPRAEDQPDPPMPARQTPPPAADQLSGRAEARIQELVAQLRTKDQELQTAMEMGRKATETASQFQARLAQLEQQHQQMLQANLENLDPDTRAQVLMDARLQQRMDEFEQRVLGRIQPKLQHLESTAAQAEMHALSQRYPGFNYQIHAPLIDQFRVRNPHCSIEQAFRAVAEPEELAPRQGARAQAVPPFVPPGNGDLGAARFAHQTAQRQQNNQEDELVEESRRIKKLRASTDPADQKEGLRLTDEHLKRRLSGR